MVDNLHEKVEIVQIVIHAIVLPGERSGVIVVTTHSLRLPDGWPAAVAVLEGTVLVNDASIARDADLTILDRDGAAVSLEASNDPRPRLLSGEPIGEPIVGHGPFVMNHQHEIERALADPSQAVARRRQGMNQLRLPQSPIRRRDGLVAGWLRDTKLCIQTRIRCRAAPGRAVTRCHRRHSP
ncbi:pirin-like C-terminal cupin domain-containing protein [Aquisalimonas sp.]|uniref:pirin-like C-terminal cupin domain-containing protein n=1 Tax=Aquisalimonas sp. TaxID=1872621 RepID=UPI0034541774